VFGLLTSSLPHNPPPATAFWALRSTFSYRDLPITSASFSADSSLLILAHADVVTLWDTQSNVMLRILDGPIRDIDIVAFVGDSGRWIVAAGLKGGLCVWDLLATDGELWKPLNQRNIQKLTLRMMDSHLV
jgi:NET1-associated nuclear protein 1 (U3 small nucleolar RNA-associated protein 17)